MHKTKCMSFYNNNARQGIEKILNIVECGVIKNGFSLLTLARPVSISDSEPVDIIVMFSGMDSDTHITQGIASIVELLDKAETLAQIRQATTVDEIIRLL